MKSVPKLIRRFIGIMLLSAVLIIGLNLILLAVYSLNQMPNRHPWQTAGEVADHLHWDGHEYVLSSETALELKTSGAWAVLIDNKTMQVIWQTDDLPQTVPVSYCASDIAGITRGYIDGYPTFTGESEKGLVVLGYPKDSFWKHMWPSWDYRLIASLPRTILTVLAMNTVLVFMIYFFANTRLFGSVKPIINGIQALSAGEAVHIKEKGLLSELAANINRTSEILQSKDKMLEKKETARANWIAGVSHDIRTPLSMVMGYACQLESDRRLPKDSCQKASVIVKQSERMRNLISDLNLASRLEYNMQPLHPEKQNVVAIVRQVAVDFINMDIEGSHPVVWETDEALTVCTANVDRDLIRRAVSNLIQNCISHNNACRIHVGVTAENGTCTITVADDGKGVSDEQLEKLNSSPHYMVCDENTAQQRHGLGLLIVRQITAAHNGNVSMGRSRYGGFEAALTLPADNI